jgi:hypothetical protein
MSHNRHQSATPVTTSNEIKIQQMKTLLDQCLSEKIYSDSKEYQTKITEFSSKYFFNQDRYGYLLESIYTNTYILYYQYVANRTNLTNEEKIAYLKINRQGELVETNYDFSNPSPFSLKNFLLYKESHATTEPQFIDFDVTLKHGILTPIQPINPFSQDNFIFLSFLSGNSQISKLVDTLKKQIEEKGKEFTLIDLTTPKPTLPNFADKQGEFYVYLNGHGNPGSDILSGEYKQNKQKFGVNTDTIVNLFLRINLPKNRHLVVDVYACYAGLAGGENQSFITTLQQKLLQAGYHSVTVRGSLKVLLADDVLPDPQAISRLPPTYGSLASHLLPIRNTINEEKFMRSQSTPIENPKQLSPDTDLQELNLAESHIDEALALQEKIKELNSQIFMSDESEQKSLKAEMADLHETCADHLFDAWEDENIAREQPEVLDGALKHYESAIKIYDELKQTNPEIKKYHRPELHFSYFYCLEKLIQQDKSKEEELLQRMRDHFKTYSNDLSFQKYPAEFGPVEIIHLLAYKLLVESTDEAARECLAQYEKLTEEDRKKDFVQDAVEKAKKILSINPIPEQKTHIESEEENPEIIEVEETTEQVSNESKEESIAEVITLQDFLDKHDIDILCKSDVEARIRYNIIGSAFNLTINTARDLDRIFEHPNIINKVKEINVEELRELLLKQKNPSRAKQSLRILLAFKGGEERLAGLRDEFLQNSKKRKRKVPAKKFHKKTRRASTHESTGPQESQQNSPSTHIDPSHIVPAPSSTPTIPTQEVIAPWLAEQELPEPDSETQNSLFPPSTWQQPVDTHVSSTSITQVSSELEVKSTSALIELMQHTHGELYNRNCPQDEARGLTEQLLQFSHKSAFEKLLEYAKIGMQLSYPRDLVQMTQRRTDLLTSRLPADEKMLPSHVSPGFRATPSIDMLSSPALPSTTSTSIYRTSQTLFPFIAPSQQREVQAPRPSLQNGKK